MKNVKLRNYLFENIWEWKWLHGKILYKHYNEWIKFPDDILLEAHIKLLKDIMDIEWINWNDVVYNAWD